MRDRANKKWGGENLHTCQCHTLLQKAPNPRRDREARDRSGVEDETVKQNRERNFNLVSLLLPDCRKAALDGLLQPRAEAPRPPPPAPAAEWQCCSGSGVPRACSCPIPSTRQRGSAPSAPHLARGKKPNGRPAEGAKRNAMRLPPSRLSLMEGLASFLF